MRRSRSSEQATTDRADHRRPPAPRRARPEADAGRLARGYAWLVVRLRWVVVLVWVAGAGAAALWLPATSTRTDLGGFAPPDSRAIATETASAEEFGFPVLSRTMLVQHDPQGLAPGALRRLAETTAAVARGDVGDLAPIAAVVPVVNLQEVFTSDTQGTTAVTFVYTEPGTTFPEEVEAARTFASAHLNRPDDAFVGVAGTVPAQAAQTTILYDHLLLLEAATLAVVIGIVAIKFRSVVAPLVALATAALSYFLAVRLTNLAGEFLAQGAPEELKPLVLALVLGIVTDYAIFFLSSMRDGLETGLGRVEAARASAAQTTRIVVVAGIAVAAGCAAMLVAESPFFRAFGPVLSLSVLVCVVVSVTLLPALLAILGRALFRPGRPVRARRRLSRGLTRVLTWRLVAAVVGGAVVAGLVVLGTAVGHLRLGVSFAAGLPPDSGPARAAAAASAGFAPGIVAPTELLVQGDGIGRDRDALVGLGRAIGERDGVAGVLSPGAVPDEVARRALVSDDGNSVRLLVVLDHDPLGATAIEDLERLGADLPRLLEDAGLDGARFGLAGDTAVSGELVTATDTDLRRIGIAVLVVNLVLLMVFLRAVVAPVLLLACSLLALAASLGCLALVFQDRLGHESVAFYVPFAASVLLLSLGSDYNIYGVGHVWRRAERVPLRQALVDRVPETSGAITAAGITLAASFGMLAIVPLRQFHELAFVMALGVLLDALVVRSLLVPAVLTVLGSFSAWPRRLRGADAGGAVETAPTGAG